jgi:hypothetical protein
MGRLHAEVDLVLTFTVLMIISVQILQILHFIDTSFNVLARPNVECPASESC